MTEQGSTEVVTPSEQVWQARFRDLLDGKAQAVGEYAEYIVKRLQETNAERTQVVQNLAQLEQKVAELRLSRAALEGRFMGYLTDLRKWDSPNTSTEGA